MSMGGARGGSGGANDPPPSDDQGPQNDQKNMMPGARKSHLRVFLNKNFLGVGPQTPPLGVVAPTSLASRAFARETPGPLPLHNDSPFGNPGAVHGV